MSKLEQSRSERIDWLPASGPDTIDSPSFPPPFFRHLQPAATVAETSTPIRLSWRCIGHQCRQSLSHAWCGFCSFSGQREPAPETRHCRGQWLRPASPAHSQRHHSAREHSARRQSNLIRNPHAKWDCGEPMGAASTPWRHLPRDHEPADSGCSECAVSSTRL